MLNVNRAGYALAITSGVFYALCSLLFVVWPQGYMTATAMLFHGFELTRAPHAMTLLGFILGELCMAILGFLAGAGFAAVWNALSSERRAVIAPRVVRR